MPARSLRDNDQSGTCYVPIKMQASACDVGNAPTSAASPKDRYQASDDSAGLWRFPWETFGYNSLHIPTAANMGVPTPLPLRLVCTACGLLTAFFVLSLIIYLVGFQLPHEHGLLANAAGLRKSTMLEEDATNSRAQLLKLHGELRELRQKVTQALESNRQLSVENQRLKDLTDKLKSTSRPFQLITGREGHILPEMYGKVKEKTIWSYWHHPATCPSSQDCVLPPHIQLCVETVERNRGSFDHKVVHLDEVEKYISLMELPMRWKDLASAQQKDSLMNALLARYGGVAFDISMILLRPLDKYWDEMVAKGAAFRGYMYRINGRPWRHAEVTVVWFLMARREGVFSTVVRNHVIGMGDRADTGAFRHTYLALGDQCILPVLSMYNYTLPKCYTDSTVRNTQKCPEYEQPPWYEAITGPARNDTRLLLEDPREGPQLPFAWLGMEAWQVADSTIRSKQSEWMDNGLGSPMNDTSCASMKECWDDVFMARYKAGRLNFVKFFKHGASMETRSRKDILADRGTYFYNWLRLAGLPVVEAAV